MTAYLKRDGRNTKGTAVLRSYLRRKTVGHQLAVRLLLTDRITRPMLTATRFSVLLIGVSLSKTSFGEAGTSGTRRLRSYI